MPILALGTYSARLAGSDDALVRASPGDFTYLPLNWLLWLALVGLSGAVIRSFRRMRPYPRSRYLVLVPGIVGLPLALFLGHHPISAFSIPLQALTILFLVTYWLRLKGTLRGSLLALGACLVTSLGTMLVLPGNLNQSASIAGVQGLAIGACIGFPLFAIRVAIRRRVTGRRLLLGLLIGVGAPILVMGVFFGLFSHAPWWAFPLVISFLGFHGIIYSVLVRWNSWARDVVTGAMFRPAETPTTPAA